MKKQILLFLSVCICLWAHATGPNLVTVATTDAANGQGAIIKYTGGDTVVSGYYSMTTPGSAWPMTQAANGKLYGTTPGGGVNSLAGTLYEYDYAANTYTTKVQMPIQHAPTGKLVLAANGKMYGLTYGSDDSLPALYEYTPGATSVVMKKADNLLNNAQDLSEANGKLYIVCKTTILEYNYTTNTLVLKANADQTPGVDPINYNSCGAMTLANNGRMYLLASSDNVNMVGYMLEYTPGDTALRLKITFPTSVNNVFNGNLASVIQATDGKLYGANCGDANGQGVLWNCDLATFTFHPVHVFADGSLPYDIANPKGSLVQASDGKIYGVSDRSQGPWYLSYQGGVFQYDINTGAYTVEKIWPAVSGRETRSIMEYVTNTPPPPAVNTWTGGFSTSWVYPANWSSGAVPTCADDAIIAAGTPYAPVINFNATVKNLTINTGATLSFDQTRPNLTLSLCGSLTNNGTASLGSGKVVLQGNGLINGYSVIANLDVTGTYAISGTAADKVDVAGVLNLISGALNTNGKLTLKSNGTKTALIADNGGTINGDVVIERVVSGSLGYHHLSSPLDGATLARMSGITPSGTNGLASTVQAANVDIYNEPANTGSTLNTGYYNYTSPTNPLTSGMGLSMYMPAATLIKFTGAPATGAISRNITKLGSNASTAGWNLIGNPYPSPMRWSLLKNANPGVMNGTCYIWKTSGGVNGSWQAYNGTYGVNGVGDEIAEGQGFFILKSAAGTSALSFTNAMRTQSLTAAFYKTNSPDNAIRLSLTHADVNAEALAYTDAAATEGYDAESDAIMPSVDGMGATHIAFASHGQNYLIHTTDAISAATVLPLSIHTQDAGDYSLSAAELNVSGLPVYLYDRITGRYTDLNRDAVTISSAGNEDINNYAVVFSQNEGVKAGMLIYGKTGAIAIERESSQTPATIIVTNMLGQQIINTTTTNSRIELPVATTNAIYIVSVKENGKETIQKVSVR